MDDPVQVARIVPMVLSLTQDPQAAAERASAARQFVEKRQRETMGVLARELAKS